MSARRIATIAALVVAAVPAAPPLAAQATGAAAVAPAGRWEAAELETPRGTLYGTLQLPPADSGPVPVALVIAGSGPTDRNGNTPVFTGPNNSLKMLAEELAAAGVATLRYDKRGIAASRAAATSEAAMTFDQLVDDAAVWVRQLRADPRFSTVSVIGHSEGALVALLAGERERAAGVVSVAGMGEPMPAVLRRQLRPQLPPALYDEADRALARLQAGERVDSVNPALASLLRPSVQPYLISVFRHDPAAIAARLPVPLLIVQGTTDVQVGVEQAERLQAAQPQARLLRVEGMNHVLKLRSGTLVEQLPSYSDPSLPLAPALVPGVAAFIRALPPAQVPVRKD